MLLNMIVAGKDMVCPYLGQIFEVFKLSLHATI